MVVNPTTVNNFASLFDCTPAGRVGPRTLCWLRAKDFCRLVPDVLAGRAHWSPTVVFFCFSILVISYCRVLIDISFLYSFDFYVLGDVAQMS